MPLMAAVRLVVKYCVSGLHDVMLLRGYQPEVLFKGRDGIVVSRSR